MFEGVNPPASILDGLPDAVVEVDARWHIRYANRGAASVFDRARDELVGRDVWKALPELDTTPFAAVCRKAMTGRSSERIEARYDSLGSSFEARIFPVAG